MYAGLDMHPLKKAFFNQLAQVDALTSMFDYMPDMYFFVKDREGAIMAMNKRFIERMGALREEDIIGKNAYDLCPHELAIEYGQDDHNVISSGVSLINKLEMNQAADGSVSWFITCKQALRDRHGDVIGLVGTARNMGLTRTCFKPYETLAPVVDAIREQYAETIRVKDLACRVHMSVSTLERRFRHLFGMTLRAYITRYRVNKACELLKDQRRSIAEVAYLVGFCDHSALTRYFSRHMGMTPSAYRQARHAYL